MTDINLDQPITVRSGKSTTVGQVLRDLQNQRDGWTSAPGSADAALLGAGSQATLLAAGGTVTLSQEDRDAIVAAVTGDVVAAVKQALREGAGTGA